MIRLLFLKTVHNIVEEGISKQTFNPTFVYNE